MSTVGRAIGLDVHRHFCEVAICEAGRVRSAGRIETSPDALEITAGAPTHKGKPTGVWAPASGCATPSASSSSGPRPRSQIGAKAGRGDRRSVP